MEDPEESIMLLPQLVISSSHLVATAAGETMRQRDPLMDLHLTPVSITIFTNQLSLFSTEGLKFVVFLGVHGHQAE